MKNALLARRQEQELIDSLVVFFQLEGTSDEREKFAELTKHLTPRQRETLRANVLRFAQAFADGRRRTDDEMKKSDREVVERIVAGKVDLFTLQSLIKNLKASRDARQRGGQARADVKRALHEQIRKEAGELIAKGKKPRNIAGILAPKHKLSKHHVGDIIRGSTKKAAGS